MRNKWKLHKNYPGGRGGEQGQNNKFGKLYVCKTLIVQTSKELYLQALYPQALYPKHYVCMRVPLRPSVQH